MKTRFFTRVKHCDTGVEGDVYSLLSQQFTVAFDNGTLGYLFYADEGVVWEGLDDPVDFDKTEHAYEAPRS